MRKILSLFAVVTVIGGSLAADGIPVAQAPSVTPAPTVVTWYGMAMLRLREEIVTNSQTNGSTEEKATYSNQVAYKIGAKVKPNDQVTLQFELGNDWNATEEVKGIPGNYYAKRDPMTPWFSLAFAEWNPGYAHVTAGIIPVRETTLMNLLGVSIWTNKTYALAAHLQWGVLTNFGQTALRVGAPILKNDFKLGVEIMSAVIEQRPALLGIDNMNANSPAVEFLIEVPMSYKAFTATPQFYVIPNRSFNNTLLKGDAEIGVGTDFGYQLNEGASFRGGLAFAQNSNAESYRAGDSVATDPFDASKGKQLDMPFDRSGLLGTIGATIKMGPGKFVIDLNINTYTDEKSVTIDDIYSFFDLKYGWAVNKNFTVMPRVRLFGVMPKVKYDSKLATRPELILSGAF
jgi:hypothetical protein